MDEIAVNAALEYLKGLKINLDFHNEKQIKIRSYIGRGSEELIKSYESYFKESKVPLSNDTSFGVSHWPPSRLERLVFTSADILNKHLNLTFLGKDIKVCGLRQNNKFSLTIAAAFLCEQVKNTQDYLSKKKMLKEELLARLINNPEMIRHNIPVEIISLVINTADGDNPSSDDIYITATGTSAEAGDDGAVGRGNRITGLITPGRPTSLEVSAGKKCQEAYTFTQ